MEKTIQSDLPWIVCPACGKARIRLPAIAAEIVCPQCSARFPEKNGYIDLLEKRPENYMLQIDAPMEWSWLIEIYESSLWRRNPLFPLATGIPFNRELETILGAHNLKGDETVLDLACGPGIFTRPFARKAPRGTVIGFDLSAPMLNYAVRKARRENLKNILFLRGNGMDLPFAEESFDVVNICGAIHLFPETLKLLTAIWKILKPGGTFTSASGRRPEGRLAQKWVDRAEKRSGLTYLSDQRGLDVLRESGFGQRTILHNKRFWIILYAKK